METIIKTTKQIGAKNNNNRKTRKKVKTQNNTQVIKTISQKRDVKSRNNNNRRNRQPACTAYTNTILQPQFYKGVGVPGQLGAATIPVHRHVTVPVTANATGFIAIAHQPYSLHDTGDSKSVFGLCNGVTYDGINNVNYVSTAVNLSLGGTNIDGYRLVSCEMQVHPQIAMLNMTGMLYGAVTHCDNVTPNGFGSLLAYSANFGNAATIENYQYSATANVSLKEGLRMIYLPGDNHDFEFYNENIDAVAGTFRECTFIIVGSGFPASSKFNVELYYNFEFIPLVGSILQGMETVIRDYHQPNETVLKVMAKPELVVHNFRDISHTAYTETPKTIIKIVDRPVFGSSNWTPRQFGKSSD
jgi:hypothetical protein